MFCDGFNAYLFSFGDLREKGQDKGPKLVDARLLDARLRVRRVEFFLNGSAAGLSRTNNLKMIIILSLEYGEKPGEICTSSATSRSWRVLLVVANGRLSKSGSLAAVLTLGDTSEFS